MSEIIKFAERELDAIGMTADSEDESNRDMRKCILDILAMFAGQGHSGLSAAYCIGKVEQLANFEPLSPLTGEDDEWSNVSEASGMPMWQNKRCSHVFKEGDGQAYDIDGKVFRDANGCCYTNRDSRVFVTFPYTPKTEYVDVPSGLVIDVETRVVADTPEIEG